MVCSTASAWFMCRGQLASTSSPAERSMPSAFLLSVEPARTRAMRSARGKLDMGIFGLLLPGSTPLYQFRFNRVTKPGSQGRKRPMTDLSELERRAETEGGAAMSLAEVRLFG